MALKKDAAAKATPTKKPAKKQADLETPTKKSTKKNEDGDLSVTSKKRSNTVSSSDVDTEVKQTPKRVKIEHFKEALDTIGPLPIGVTVKYDSLKAVSAKAGGNELLLKLHGSGSFSLHGTLTLADGEYKGYQAILIQPPKTFNFMDARFSPELRKLVYEHYLDYENGSPIPIDAKRKNGVEYYAKAYSGGSKNRVALLRTCKTINAEASAVLYSKTLRFENTIGMMSFLSELDDARKESLRSLTIKHYKNFNNRIAFQNLKAAKHVTKIRIENGVASNAEPSKSAEALWNDISGFCEAITQQLKLKDPSATKQDAVKIFELGQDAFAIKDGSYTDAQRAKFDETLMKKAE